MWYFFSLTALTAGSRVLTVSVISGYDSVQFMGIVLLNNSFVNNLTLIAHGLLIQVALAIWLICKTTIKKRAKFYSLSSYTQALTLHPSSPWLYGETPRVWQDISKVAGSGDWSQRK